MAKFLILLALFLFSGTTAFAQQGCCSWHGGIDYCDTSSGSYVCNDGTYSPTCGCAYVPPKRVAPKSPNISASFEFKPNENGTFDVYMDWDDVNTSTGYSLSLGKIAGSDPGPLVDVYNSKYVFKNISSGDYYANLKVGLDGVWSNTTYWVVDVPEWLPPTPSPTQTVLQASFVDNKAGDTEKVFLFLAVFFAVFGAGLGLYLILNLVIWIFKKF